MQCWFRWVIGEARYAVPPVPPLASRLDEVNLTRQLPLLDGE